MISVTRIARLPRPLAIAIALAWLAAAAPPAGAIALPASDSPLGANAEVNAMVRANDRTILAGAFTRFGRPTGQGADLARSDGAPDLAFARPNNTVSAVVADGSGGWYVGGQFTRMGGVARNRLAHLLADGSVDPAFDPNVGGTVSALLLAGDTLYAGGSFTTVNGSIVRNRLAALDAATGQATAFDPSVNNNQVVTLALRGTTLFAGGSFTAVGAGAGTTRNRLAAFDTVTGQATAFNPNVPSNVISIALPATGSKLYVAGGFSTINGTAVTRRRLAAVDTTTGAADPAFDPDLGAQANTVVVAGDRVYAGGTFTTVNGTVARNRLAAFDAATGAVDASFDPNASGSVGALAITDGTLYAGGSFATVNGTAASRNAIAAFDASDGSVVPGFDPNVDASVSALAVAGTRIYAGGSFTFAGADTVHTRLVALRDDGTIDPAFDAQTSGPVYALAVVGSRLYAGGDFTTVGAGVARPRLAAFDVATGAVDPGFDAAIANSGVLGLATGPAGLYVGGGFTTVGGTTRNRLAAVDPATGALNPDFNPNMNATVNRLALAGPRLYAVGSFQTVNGTTTRNFAAAVDPATGAVDAAFDPNVSGPVQAMALAGDRIYLGGQFVLVVNNNTIGRNRLAAFDATTGILDPGFTANVDQQPRALAVDGDVLYAGGDFTTLNGTPRNRAAAVDLDTGTLEPTFDPGFDGSVLALLKDDERLYAGGSFTSAGAGGGLQLRFARFPESSAPIVRSGAASAVTETSADVAGTVDANGLETAYVVEYGTSPGFGAISTPASAGSGASAVPVVANLTGLAPNTLYYYRLVATNATATTAGLLGTFTTAGAPQPPIPTTGAASAIQNAAATLNGAVDPNGRRTAYTFEYGKTEAFGAITPVGTLAGGAPQDVSAAISGLTPDTTYYFRVVATSAGGTTNGPIRSFNTGPGGAPIVATGAAVAITSGGAALTATIDPHGAETVFTFEYGTTTAFGSITTVDRAGSTNGALTVSLPLDGLAPATSYVYRVIATNAHGTAVGPVRSFTTGPVP